MFRRSGDARGIITGSRVYVVIWGRVFVEDQFGLGIEELFWLADFFFFLNYFGGICFVLIWEQ